MPAWLTAKTLDLPRWVWVSMLVGGLGIGLYLRSKGEEPVTEAEPEEEPINKGNLMPPASPIEGGGGGIYGVGNQEKPPWKLENDTPSLGDITPISEIPELPESKPPPEAIVQTPGVLVSGSPATSGPGLYSGVALPPYVPPPPNTPVGGSTYGQGLNTNVALPAPAPFKHAQPIPAPKKKKRK